MPFQALLWQKLAFSSPFSYFNYLSSILLFRRHCDVALFNPSSRFVKDHVLFMPIHLTGALCPLLKLSSPYQALHLFSTGVLSEIFLTPCSIHSIVLEAVCCDFIKYLLILPSSYSIPFLFNRSATRSCSSLFLFSNGVLSTLFISIVFFSRDGLTSSRFFGFTCFVKEAT